MKYIEETYEQIVGIYENLFLLGYKNGIDLEVAVGRAECAVEELEKEYEGHYLTKGFRGVAFLKFLSREIGTGLEGVLSLDGVLKESILEDILQKFMENENLIDVEVEDKENLDEIISVSSQIAVLNGRSTETDKIGYYTNLMEPINQLREDLYNKMHVHYCIEVKRIKQKYYLRLSYGKSVMDSLHSEYMYDRVEIDCPQEGEFIQFINKMIEKKVERLREEMQKREEDEKPCVILAEQEEHMKVNGRTLPEVVTEKSRELVLPIYDDTKTIAVLDRFEGIGKEERPYERLVISNGKRYSTRFTVYFHYVIERSCARDYIGDITFTEFKKGECAQFRQHVSNEIEAIDIEKYIDKDTYYSFSKPYHLRAQNSRNRTGYGWEWDWSGGVGDYTEGTLYGETTDYVFVGVYVSSSYTYSPESRAPFIQKVNNSDYYVDLCGALNGSYKMVVYSGKLNKITSSGVTQYFMKQIKNEKDKFCQCL